MSRATSWMCVALFCTGAIGAGRDNPAPAPPPREKPADDAWLPKPGSDPGGKGGFKIPDGTTDPPTAFPDVRPPDSLKGRGDVPRYYAAYETLCPRLFGKTLLTIDATDDTLRKLLKARIHQGTLEFQRFHRGHWGRIEGPGPNFDLYRECLLDMTSAATELWAGQPKELVPWLEELLVATKEFEWYTRIRVLNGGAPPYALNAATRTRLKMEAELWKAKNPK